MISQSLEGTLRHDRLHMSEYVRVEGHLVKNWIFDRLKEIPEGSYIKIDVEIMDVPHD